MSRNTNNSFTFFETKVLRFSSLEVPDQRLTVRHADAEASNRVLTPRLASWWSRPGSDLDSALPPANQLSPTPAAGKKRPSSRFQNQAGIARRRENSMHACL